MRKNLLTFYSPLICSPLIIIHTYSIWTVYIIIMISSMYGEKNPHLSYVKLINNCVASLQQMCGSNRFTILLTLFKRVLFFPPTE